MWLLAKQPKVTTIFVNVMGITLSMVAMAFDKFLIYFLKHVHQHEFPCVKSAVKGLRTNPQSNNSDSNFCLQLMTAEIGKFRGVPRI